MLLASDPSPFLHKCEKILLVLLALGSIELSYFRSIFSKSDFICRASLIISASLSELADVHSKNFIEHLCTRCMTDERVHVDAFRTHGRYGSSRCVLAHEVDVDISVIAESSYNGNVVTTEPPSESMRKFSSLSGYLTNM